MIQTRLKSSDDLGPSKVFLALKFFGYCRRSGPWPDLRQPLERSSLLLAPQPQIRIVSMQLRSNRFSYKELNLDVFEKYIFKVLDRSVVTIFRNNPKPLCTWRFVRA
jgi:hypothetical protein